MAAAAMQASAADRSGWSVDLGSCVRKFNIDRERRDFHTAINLHLHLVGIDADMPGDYCKDLLAQYGHEIGLADDPPFVFEQNLESFACDRGGIALTRQEAEEPHAALRPNSRLNRPFLSLGMVISICSPHRRRAAA